MLSKDEHDIVKVAAELLKRELEEIAPTSPDEKPGKLVIYKFGSFIVKRAKERQVVNPAAGGMVTVPERTAVRFSASKTWLKSLGK